jgi:exportin-1
MAEKLLDFTQPFDVPLLDATVAVFYSSSSAEEVRRGARI